MAHILIYNINEPYIHQGGMERVTDTLIRLLQRLGHRVSLLCRYRNRQMADYQCPCQLYFLPDTKTAAAFFEQLLDRLNPNIVIDQEEGGIIGPHGFFRNRNQLKYRDIRYIAVLHSSAVSALRHYRHTKHKSLPNAFLSYLYHGPFLSLLKYRAERLKRRDYSLLLQNYDWIVTLSTSGISEFATFCPPQGKLCAIPNCSLYPTLAELPMKHRQILYVGRMDNSSKRVDRLLRIWARLESDFRDWELILLGNGVDLTSNRKLASALGLKRCRFLGCCDPSDFYRRADFICLTSNFEGFGMVLLEGMQHGCIPVAFDSYPAVRELIEADVNGLLIPPFREELYAQQMAGLMQDDTKRRHMQRQALLHTQRFSPERISAMWQALVSRAATSQIS